MITKCNLCGYKSNINKFISSNLDDRFRIPTIFQIYCCCRCDNYFTNLDLSDSELKSLYKKYYSKNISKKYIFLRDLFFNSPFFSFFNYLDGDQYFIPRKKTHLSLLDFGCYEGRQLILHKNKYRKVAGYEFNKIAAQLARKKGFTVYDCSYNKLLKMNLNFDVIIMSNVFEHINNPNHILNNLHKLLNNNGLIKIAVPNYDSIFRLVFKSAWSNYHVPFHLNHFSKTTLTNFFKKYGYTLTKSVTVTPSYGLCFSLMNVIGIINKKRNFLLIFFMLFFLLLKPLIFFLNLNNKGDILKLEFKYEK